MKRILAAFALLMAGVLAGGWAAAQVNGSGGVYVNGVLQGVGGGTGTVTSVGLTLPSFMNVSGTNPITTSGTFVFGLANVSAGAVFTGPASGADAAPTFKTLLAPNFGISDSSGVLTSNGSGTWSITTPAGTGANTPLSNLANIAIDTTDNPKVLNPASDAVLGLGSAGSRFSSGWFSGAVYSSVLRSPVLEQVAPTTDSPPGASLVKAGDAFPGAATNTAGANTILAGGIGKRIFTVVAYDNATVPLSTVTITVNGTATVKTEGTDWFDTTGNNEMATSLASAINGISGVSATASSAVVRIVPGLGTYSLTIAKTAADAGMTATSGTDGVVTIAGKASNSSGDQALSLSVPGIISIGDNTTSPTQHGVYLRHLTGNGPQYQTDWLAVQNGVDDNTPLGNLFANYLGLGSYIQLGPGTGIRWYEHMLVNPIQPTTPRTGLVEVSGGGGLKITDGSTGWGSASLLSTKFFDGGTHYTTIQAQTQAADITWTLPPVVNVSGALRNDGTGSLTWGHELLTDQFTYTFFDLNTDLPATLDVPSIYVNRARAIHLTEVYCEIDAGSATINLTKNGANIATADITCAVTPSGTDGTTGILDNSGSHFVSGKDAIAVGDKIGHVMVTVGASLKRLNVVTKYVVD